MISPSIVVFTMHTCPLSVGRPILSDTSPIALQIKIHQNRLETPSFHSFPSQRQAVLHQKKQKITVSPVSLFLHPIEGHKICISPKTGTAHPATPPALPHIINFVAVSVKSTEKKLLSIPPPMRHE